MSSVMHTGHVGLNVTDLDRSVRFYQHVFELEVHKQGSDDAHPYALLGRDGKLLLTLWQQSKGDFSPATPGLHHLSFQVDAVEDVRAAEARLRELAAGFLHDGVVPHAEGADSGGIFFTDPDGIRLEIYTPSGLAGVAAPSGAAPTCGFF